MHLTGLMMNSPLLISGLIRHAARVHADQTMVSRTVEGPIHRTTWRELEGRSQQLAQALQALGVGPGDRVATLAWNGFRHVETYFAVSGIGAVCHTLNPRLFPDQLLYILNHAEDVVLLTDLTFVPLVEKLAPRCPHLRAVVVMTDREHMPQTTLPNAHVYEDILAAQPGNLQWPEFPEDTASSLCYTSGTTGEPKGVLYSHRSTVLHSFGISLPDVFRLGERETVLPVVPMFHVNAWGLPYAAALTGTRLVMPGPRLDGESLYNLFEDEGVTMSAGVPTVWMGLLAYMRQHGHRFRTLNRVIIGGSAAPEAMIRAFQDDYGVEVLHAWGMTETSPLGTACGLSPAIRTWPKDQQIAVQRKQGRQVFGVELRIVGDDGQALAHDGAAAGDLQIRGPWVCSGYYRAESTAHHDGWFSTGDVATIDPAGYMQITDRSKDVIKSGGEWISSIALENLAVGVPGVAEAAVIGVPHARWAERPLLVLVKAPGAEVDPAVVLAHIAESVPKWWLPDAVEFVDALPHTATGKISKLQLRERFKDYRLAADCAER
ncbi:3-(methylthio)propionyl-CoA ligase [Nannocystis sp. SCPEA4]|uniref:3-(methylthio)propionyl-CoA ligase n=1 Tax=Nannocystis sp. SCPEA4 TaxID=2996787 RepID=UPI0022701922|nr:3-(methylthio)propionyl-CoA ligase [Nannocystis sp. SCPEA4]MCY1056267.1 3-(methylthio)propionyl-CoA ligase [Nannocystis sp. SCPEA4]